MADDVPRWAVMWTLCAAIFAGCKWMTWRQARVAATPAWRHVAYLVAWPGMDADAFLGGSAPTPPSRTEWTRATALTALGASLFFGVGRYAVAGGPWLAGWIGMAGLVLMLHFGSFHLLSCGWRRAGVDAPPLMHAPARSTSLAEFWGRRWNTAFRDLTHRFVFAPLVPSLGVHGALLAGFLVSGVLHDAVISWPAGGGFGGPTAFFAAQGIGVLAERSAVGRTLGLSRGWRGRTFTAAAILLPLTALFHRPFLEGVVVPFMDALGAL